MYEILVPWHILLLDSKSQILSELRVRAIVVGGEKEMPSMHHIRLDIIGLIGYSFRGRSKMGFVLQESAPHCFRDGRKYFYLF